MGISGNYFSRAHYVYRGYRGGFKLVGETRDIITDAFEFIRVINADVYISDRCRYGILRLGG